MSDMFDDVGAFHEKFGLTSVRRALRYHVFCPSCKYPWDIDASTGWEPAQEIVCPKCSATSRSYHFNVADPDHRCDRLEVTPPQWLDKGLQDFRIKFIEEELRELKEGYERRDMAQVADSLVDLAYVVLGLAHLHRLPWQRLWDAVQAANMAKERCGIDHHFHEPGDGSDRCSYNFHDGESLRPCWAPAVKHSKRGNANDVIKPEGWTAPDVTAILAEAGYSAETAPDPLAPRADDPRFLPLEGGAAPTHYVNVHHGSQHRSAIFVKEAGFFAEQGGLVQDWGRNWRPVFVCDHLDVVSGIEAARDAGWEIAQRLEQGRRNVEVGLRCTCALDRACVAENVRPCPRGGLIYDKNDSADDLK